MDDHKVIGMPFSDEQLGNIDGGAGAVGDCAVKEGEFPCLGKCCVKSSSLTSNTYQKTCHYCSIWASLPEGISLSVTYIVECSCHGYGKRIKD